MKTFVVGLAFACSWAIVTATLAQDEVASPEVDAEVEAIRQQVETYVAAYNRQDASAISGLWAEHGVYVNHETGDRVQGRQAIAEMFRKQFATRVPVTLQISIDAIRFARPEVAVEDGTAITIPKDGTPLQSGYTAVYVKENGKWLLDSIRETVPPGTTHPGKIAELEWLIGTWVDEDEQATIRTQYQWSKNQKFITGSFHVMIGDDVQLEGAHIIGWDPYRGQLRSWVFDSEGGFGEEIWRQNSEQWIVEGNFTLADGAQGSSVRVLTRLSEDAFSQQVKERLVNGESQGEVPVVTVRRQ